MKRRSFFAAIASALGLSGCALVKCDCPKVEPPPAPRQRAAVDPAYLIPGDIIVIHDGELFEPIPEDRVAGREHWLYTGHGRLICWGGDCNV